jgi:hypothetical protein
VVVQLRVVPLPGKVFRFVPEGQEGFVVMVRLAVGPPPPPVPVVVPVPVPVVVPVPVLVPVPVPALADGFTVAEAEALADGLALGERDDTASVPLPLDPQAASVAALPAITPTVSSRKGRKIDMGS